MTQRRRAALPARAVRFAIAGMAVAGGALVGAAPGMADPEVPIPVPIPADPGAPAPDVGPVPGPDPAAGDLVAAPPPGPVLSPGGIPQIANPNYGSGGGIFGTISDLWHQVQNPYYAPGEGPQAAPAPPPGAGPAPALPPGYVSTNAPGSETQSTRSSAPADHPALPPGYYSTSGPPPPGYEFTNTLPGQAAPAAPAQ